MIRVREERPADIPAIRALNGQAFGRPAEARIVDRLRTACPGSILSLVAEDGDTLIGHILFSPAVAKKGTDDVIGMGLAPMAVAPGRQNQGIGSLLVSNGIDILVRRGCPFVIVLGHPGYYPRFGFIRASALGLRCQWTGVPDEVFMVLVLDEDRMKGAKGIVRYRDEFRDAI